MGILLFWLQYIIAVILLYHILKCIYIKKENKKITYGYTIYSISKDDERLKHSLFIIVLFILVLLIPILNIIVFGIYLASRLLNENGSEYNKYYCKSLFTKKY